MSQKAVSTFFDNKSSESYDERNRRLLPIIKNLHFLTQLVLADLPADAHILCVGVGTGEEIMALASTYPGWKFTGVEPSAPMCDICQKKIEDAGLASRCTIVNGYVADIDDAPEFDAALCFLVTHFITDLTERQGIFTGMHRRLKPGGYLINADISNDEVSARVSEQV